MRNQDDILKNCIENSEKICWKISDLLPDQYNISYKKRFLPIGITKEESLGFLNANDKKHLNHIWGAAYFNIFSFVEEYITLFSLSFANDSSFKEVNTLRAFVRFSEEEIKHQLLFKKYIQKFNATFVTQCRFINNERDVASTILTNTQLSVLILTYHLELITQQHYTEVNQCKSDLDEKYTEILRCHWLEEAQHAQLDLFKIREIASETSLDEFNSALSEYFSIIDAFVALLKKQVEMNYESLASCSDETGKFENINNKNMFIELQHQAYIDLFILKGFENKMFLKELKKCWPTSIKRINDKATSLKDVYQTHGSEKVATSV